MAFAIIGVGIAFVLGGPLCSLLSGIAAVSVLKKIHAAINTPPTFNVK